jgi:hypothetical protein
MTPSFLRPIARDAFESLVEQAIGSPRDLYDLDGDTVLVSRNGRVQTCDRDLGIYD